MKSKIEKFLDWAEDHRWKVRRYAGDAEIPAAILSRYENIPEEYLRFLRKTALLATPDETGWFNCRPDFEGASDSAFRWNEFEIISLQAAGHDEARRQDIRKFWDTNLPAFLSVKSGYAFHAINTDNRAMTYGREPEFEEVKETASSFLDFLELIMAGRLRLDS